MVDEDGHPSTITTPRSISPDDRVARDRRVFRADLELCLLKTCDLDMMRVEIFRQRLRTTPQTITVPLDNGLRERRRRRRAGMRLDSRKEEDENQATNERRRWRN